MTPRLNVPNSRDSLLLFCNLKLTDSAVGSGVQRLTVHQCEQNWCVLAIKASVQGERIERFAAVGNGLFGLLDKGSAGPQVYPVATKIPTTLSVGARRSLSNVEKAA